MEELDVKNDEQQVFPELVLITGMSGAGRTESMHVFEDLGYFCVDNLPTRLIDSLVELQMQDKEDVEQAKKIAFVCDARNGKYFAELADEIRKIRTTDTNIRVVFLDANDEKLVARYKASRRRHPLCDEGTTIAEGIQREKSMMLPIKEMADTVIDTSDMLPQNLRQQLRSMFESSTSSRGLSVTVYSFGFKHGAPVDADIVIDVRFLPNPYYVAELKPLTGLDPAVRDYVMLRDETVEFEKKWHELLDVLMPGYVKEGKQQLAIGIGCTGGQHRSVAIAESTGAYLQNKGYRASIAHRDLEKR
ncbi:MAG: RNase adapter RapZ [Phoenicibacter congonensis]|uniref:RNase adapter RapZ n=1 Tax=Phoenicibacter congonensis TaxID=1944646 RepID=A0AA43U8G8_9ACTN|nr:RNase adapter RapZ [Phoenicibacter congonensis]